MSRKIGSPPRGEEERFAIVAIKLASWDVKLLEFHYFKEGKPTFEQFKGEVLLQVPEYVSRLKTKVNLGKREDAFMKKCDVFIDLLKKGDILKI